MRIKPLGTQKTGERDMAMRPTFANSSQNQKGLKSCIRDSRAEPIYTKNDKSVSLSYPFKGSLTRDFRLKVFFMNQCPPGPQVFHWGRFEFFRKFSEIFANEYLISLTPAINCSAVSATPAKNLLPVSLTPPINPCHGEINKKPIIFRRCQRHRRKTVHRCQRHRR